MSDYIGPDWFECLLVALFVGTIMAFSEELLYGLVAILGIAAVAFGILSGIAFAHARFQRSVITTLSQSLDEHHRLNKKLVDELAKVKQERDDFDARLTACFPHVCRGQVRSQCNGHTDAMGED